MILETIVSRFWRLEHQGILIFHRTQSLEMLPLVWPFLWEKVLTLISLLVQNAKLLFQCSLEQLFSSCNPGARSKPWLVLTADSEKNHTCLLLMPYFPFRGQGYKMQSIWVGLLFCMTRKLKGRLTAGLATVTSITVSHNRGSVVQCKYYFWR